VGRYHDSVMKPEAHIESSPSPPIGSGVAASLARPGGNVTGVSNIVRRQAGKELELLKTVVPRLGHRRRPEHAQEARTARFQPSLAQGVRRRTGHQVARDSGQLRV